MTAGEAAGWTAETADDPQRAGFGENSTPVSREHARAARVREDSTSTSEEPGMSDCGSAEATAEPAADTDSNRSRAFLARLLGRLHPPDAWEQDRPSLGKLHAYAYRGAGAPPDGSLRTGSIRWFWMVTFPVTGWAYQKARLLERPFLGSLVLVAQVAWWVLNIATLIHFFL